MLNKIDLVDTRQWLFLQLLLSHQVPAKTLIFMSQTLYIYLLFTIFEHDFLVCSQLRRLEPWEDTRGCTDSRILVLSGVTLNDSKSITEELLGVSIPVVVVSSLSSVGILGD